MKANDKIDAARVDLLLTELRLSGVKLVWSALAATADKEGWPAARFLAALVEQELADRGQRRFARHLSEARLPPGKTLDAFDFDAVPMISKAQVQALAAGDAWLEKGANLLMFGPPGVGKSHLAAALGLALIENGWRVLFARTTDLVQKLQVARRDLALEAAIDKLDKYHLLILDDLAYVAKDQAETSVLFELISARYERRSLAHHRKSALRRMGKNLPGPGHDARRRRQARPSRDDLRNERRQLSPKSRDQKSCKVQAGLRRARQSKPHLDCRSASIKTTVTKNPLALLSLRDNHLVTATETSHPVCRALLIQIVAPYDGVMRLSPAQFAALFEGIQECPLW